MFHIFILTHFQISRIIKTLATYSANIRPFSSVSSHMRPQCVSAKETFFADGTLVCLLFKMCLSVSV